MTVLIMEDDEAYGYALSRALTKAGRTPVLCSSWSEYLQRIESDPMVRSAVIDIRLPAGSPNGVALARMTRNKRPGVKVVVVSSDPALLNDVPEGVQAYPKSRSLTDIAAAANDWIAKPDAV